MAASINPNQVTININSKDQTVELGKMPGFGNVTISIFDEILGKTAASNLNIPFFTASNLKQAQQKLKDAKDHETRNKIFGILRAAFFVSAIAAIVLIPVFLGKTNDPFNLIYSGGMGLAIGLYLTTHIFLGKDWFPANLKCSQFAAIAVASPIATPILTIQHEWQRVKNRQKDVNKIKTTFESQLGVARSFVMLHSKDLQAGLNERKKAKEDLLKELNLLPSATSLTPTVQNELQTLTLADQQLKNAVDFYSKF